jgi:hypothetical protein
MIYTQKNVGSKTRFLEKEGFVSNMMGRKDFFYKIKKDKVIPLQARCGPEGG